MDKTKFLAHLKAEIKLKVQNLENELAYLQQDLNDDSKSTSGDKHETGRAMLHLEQEKLSGQMSHWGNISSQISALQPTKIKEPSGNKNEKINTGSLIQTNSGYFFIGIGYGKTIFESEEIFCMNSVVPFAQNLMGKVKGDSFLMNGNVVEIKSIF